MRDFRDAKVMARALRDALKEKAVETTHAEALELIARAFGYDNWNILSAKIEAAEPETSNGIAIRGEATAAHNNAHPPQFPTTATMHRALAHAIQRNHQYETLEHLLLALIDDVDASAVMKACKVDLGALKERLTNYIDEDLKTMATNDSGEPKQSAGFQRVVQRAALYAEGRGRPNRTGAELLVAIFAETESPAARLLGEQDMTRQDAINFVIHGIAKGGGDTPL
jgi:Glyoxalase superfamily protein/Clp amino terminal domain, pathogenicity island component